MILNSLLDLRYSIDALALSATNGGNEVVKIKPLAVDLIASQIRSSDAI